MHTDKINSTAESNLHNKQEDTAYTVITGTLYQWGIHEPVKNNEHDSETSIKSELPRSNEILELLYTQYSMSY